MYDCSINWNKSDSLHGILMITLQILQLKLQLSVRLYFDNPICPLLQATQINIHRNGLFLVDCQDYCVISGRALRSGNEFDSYKIPTSFGGRNGKLKKENHHKKNQCRYKTQDGYLITSCCAVDSCQKEICRKADYSKLFAERILFCQTHHIQNHAADTCQQQQCRKENRLYGML